MYAPQCTPTVTNSASICAAALIEIQETTNFQTLSRIDGARNVVINSALRNYYGKSMPAQQANDDENIPSKIGSYSKGLPHNSIGEVDINAYQTLANAVALNLNGSGQPYTAFDNIQTSGYQKLVNPMCGLSFDLEGYDSHFMTAPAAPSVYSQEAMDEVLENYWMSLTRDISFDTYESNATIIEAAADLTTKTAFNGPRINNIVTPTTLYRASFYGCLDGPYISQFLYLDCPYGASKIDQRIKTYLPNTNFMKEFSIFLDIQKGKSPTEVQQFDPVLRYIRNGRDLSQWVHMDVLYGAYFNAMNILMTTPTNSTQNAGIGCPLSINNPYRSPNSSSVNQVGFGTFGAPHLSTILAEVSQRALKMAWFQKWFVQKRLRPEALGGLIYNERNNIAQYGLNKDYLTSSYFSQPNSNYLLEQAFPEGSPLHPSYLAGHSSVAGACVTILKAWFDCEFEIPNPKVPNSDGTALVDYDGVPLTVGGELNKLVSNIGLGRNFAGVHYYSDMYQSTLLGEEIAITVLQDQKYLYNENFAGWTFKKFDGSTITI